MNQTNAVCFFLFGEFRFSIQLLVNSVGALFAKFQMRLTLIDTVRIAQIQDLVLRKLKEDVSKGEHADYTIWDDDGALVLGNRLCVLDDLKLKREILEDAHSSVYVMHPCTTKMYRVLRELLVKWNEEKSS